MTVLVCGEALYDVFVAGETAAGFQLDARIGGSAFNVAMGLARLGQPVGLLTGISTDPMGEGLVRALEREGVATRFLKRPDAPTTLALVALADDGSARYRFYGEGAAERQVTEADLPDPDGLDALVFGCFSMLTRPTGDSFLKLAERAAGRALVAVDPNVRPTVEPDMDRWRGRVEAFAARADLVKASAEDMQALYAEPPEAVARRWLDGGASLVALTRGGEGAALHTREGVVEAPGRPVAVADTVGAGDAFLAALLTALGEMGLRGPGTLAGIDAGQARRALALANEAAALTCTRRGADLPRRSDLSHV